jgi:hypothetical protein
VTNPRLEPGSYRDRDGRVLYFDGQVYRLLSARALEEWTALAATSFFQELVAEGKVVATELVEEPAPELSEVAAGWAGVLRHERIPWISYPYEWSFGMMKRAALLQLELMERALGEGFVLKDASAYNIQWRGVKPVFIDIPSFQRPEPGEAWMGYLQFCRLHLYPLMMTSLKGIPFQPWLRGSLDGISPQECARFFGITDLLRPGVLVDVQIQSRLQNAAAASERSVREEVKDSGFTAEMIGRNVRRLSKVVRKLDWSPPRSAWSDYAEEHGYDDVDAGAKETFVRSVADEKRWSTVWDLGSNTGTFSRILAESSECVIAVDADHPAVERLFAELVSSGPDNILPQVGNLADPSPAMGWRWMERGTFADRGSPELILFLALVHHVVLGANVPLGELVAWLASLTDNLLIEWVDRGDPMVERLLLNKEDLFSEYERDNFEAVLGSHFEIRRRQELGSGTRVLYLAGAKS